MKPLAAVALLALALPSPAQQPGGQNGGRPVARKAPLLSSQISGRDMQFITQTMDQLKTLELLALDASVATNKELRDFGRQVAHSVSQHAWVLSTLAEMRNIPETPRDSPLRKEYIKRLADGDEKRMEATLIELLLTTDRELLATAKAAEHSQDTAVREFALSLLPDLGSQAKTIAGFHTAQRPVAPKTDPGPALVTENTPPAAVPAKPARPLPKVKKREF